MSSAQNKESDLEGLNIGKQKTQQYANNRLENNRTICCKFYIYIVPTTQKNLSDDFFKLES